MNKDDELQKYRETYNEDKLWSKISKYAKKAGLQVVYYVLILYHTLKSADDIGVKNKALIIGTLGYFISPFDVIPDFLIGGYIDDVSVLVAAITALGACITSGVKEGARKKLHEFFDFKDDELNDL